MTDQSEHSDQDLGLPRRLAEDLARLQYTPTVPPQVDMAVLATAKLRLRRQRRFRRLARWAGVAAAAAIIAVAVYTLPVAHQPAAKQVARVAARPTILDAFQLARQLEQGPILDRRWDINGDGVVDRRDVDALALAAVSLKGEKV